VPNKKNMASRYANAHARRESRRRAEARAHAAEDAELIGTDEPASTMVLSSPLGGATLSAGGTAVAPAPRPPIAPRPERSPIAPSGAVAPRSGANRAPVRPHAGVATVVDYSYLRGDLQRIAALSLSLLVLLIVLNLLLNH
jgi:hypothetical protein